MDLHWGQPKEAKKEVNQGVKREAQHVQILKTYTMFPLNAVSILGKDQKKNNNNNNSNDLQMAKPNGASQSRRSGNYQANKWDHVFLQSLGKGQAVEYNLPAE
ncbi:hypothetical protein QJS10_CPB15g01809 [Acorus calamus]|uniref:Uncharacterized protein n=1 Tax=Acorus calamus TaxID=4465 RepID=A0AAV9D953_ACOCL|nr:hypothetical protein QJS10_CPB15g01809 [Acorus calamus]